MNSLHKLLAIAALAVATQAMAADWAPGSTDWDKLPEIKKSKVGLYLTPQQAYDMKKANPKGVAFFDVRTRPKPCTSAGPATPTRWCPTSSTRKS
jgi:hypothetical protein